MQSIERDSSFIVMHCGSFERIAFRHRSSRTLFISELIDVTRCKDPAYGEIQVGLYMSIIQDVFDRTRQLVQHEAETDSKHPRKRKREPVCSSESKKRPKTRAGVAEAATRRIEHQKDFKVRLR